MILFLDTVSSLPEFFLIEDNKIVFSKKIIDNCNEKMSDCIIPKYIELDTEFSLKKNLTDIIVNIGPGSYTALRIGIAFVSGLSISQKIDLKGLSCVDLYRYCVDEKDLESSALFICSSNDQNFFCLYENDKNIHKIYKVENENNLSNLINDKLKTIYYNDKIKYKSTNLKNINYKLIKFENLVFANIKKILKIPNQKIIQPIYVSNNKILN
tara:strand:- start:617 stop:1252 length:636 start_codon:yes stop_codon:yes gene_type:complete